MPGPGQGDAKSDALAVLLFFVALFVIWIVVGGPAQDADSLFIDDPLNPYVIDPGTTTISSATSTIATSTGILTNLNSGRLITIIAVLAAIFLVGAARLKSTSSS